MLKTPEVFVAVEDLLRVGVSYTDGWQYLCLVTASGEITLAELQRRKMLRSTCREFALVEIWHRPDASQAEHQKRYAILITCHQEITMAMVRSAFRVGRATRHSRVEE
jgi:hypothetical protein